MKIVRICICLLILSILKSAPLIAQPFYISTGLTANQLAYKISGPGISISNVTGQLHPGCNGKFDSSAVTGINFSSGIMLSTGLIGSFLDTSSTVHNSTDVGLGGDPDLDDLTFPLLTEDSEMLEFDFIAASDSVEFTFRFASEDYNDYINDP